MSIFPDDAPLDARQDTVYRLLLSLVPVAFRIPMQGELRKIVRGCTVEQLAQIQVDVGEAQAAVDAGDIERVLQVARHWASAEQIDEYLAMVKAGDIDVQYVDESYRRAIG